MNGLTGLDDEWASSVFAEIDSLFTYGPVEFSGEHAAVAANQFIESQVKLRQSVLNVAIASVRGTTVAPSASNAATFIRDRILAPAATRFASDVNNVGKAFIVTANMPLIVERPIKNLELIFAKKETAIRGTRSQEQVCATILGRLMYFFGQGADNISIETFGDLQFSIIAALGTLGALQQMKLAEGTRLALETRILDRQVAVEDRYQALADEVTEAQARVRAATESIGELHSNIENTRLELVRQGEAAEGAQNALLEKFGLAQTQSLWKNQAVKARRSYFASLTVLLVMLIGIPVAAVVFHAQIIDFLTDIETAVVKSVNGEGVVAAISAISRLLIITAPLALLVWAIKLIVRFNIRSMLLMDDAEQRVTMLNTYLFLVERNAATIQDRGALLEAMFRRAPGHGPESIDPPNITDIMKYGEVMGQKP